MSAYTATPVPYWLGLPIGQFLAWMEAEAELVKQNRPKKPGR